MKRIGVVATPLENAAELRDSLGLPEDDTVLLTARRTSSGRGFQLDALLFDHSVSRERIAELLPCLIARGGRAFELRRII